MNTRTEIQASQMVNNRGFKNALKDVRKNIDIYKDCVDEDPSKLNINGLNYLNKLEEEIIKLKEE